MPSEPSEQLQPGAASGDAARSPEPIKEPIAGSVSIEACAGGVVFDERRRLLVVRRAHPPGAGLWTIPGGRCLPGEVPADACVRELAEETALVVRVVRHVGAVRRPGPVDDVVYEIDDFLCERISGSLRAGDDADDAQWVSLAQLAELPTVPGLVDALTQWQVLPA